MSTDVAPNCLVLFGSRPAKPLIAEQCLVLTRLEPLPASRRFAESKEAAQRRAELGKHLVIVLRRNVTRHAERFPCLLYHSSIAIQRTWQAIAFVISQPEAKSVFAMGKRTARKYIGGDLCRRIIIRTSLARFISFVSVLWGFPGRCGIAQDGPKSFLLDCSYRA